MQTLRGMKKFADGEDAVERVEERTSRGGDLSLRLCGVSRRQRQLNKAISFPVVCRKQLSAAAASAFYDSEPLVINLLRFNWSAPHCGAPAHPYTR